MPHPHISQFAALARPARTARDLGYRMPAEWEPVRRIWVTQPHLRATWPGCLTAARDQFRQWLAAMRPFVEVAVTQRLGIRTNDSWIRDYGPIFVTRPVPPGLKAKPPAGTRNPHAKARHSPAAALPQLALHDFHFNVWGGKYAPRPQDDLVPQHIARKLGVPLWVHDLVLEGGSIDVNSCGTVLTTRQCLLNPNRNPRKRPREIIRKIHEALGTHHVIWLPGGIIGDDTDGHVDDVARFIAADTVAAVRTPDARHPDHAMLEANWRALRQARDQDGRRLNLLALPAPEPLRHRFPATAFRPAGAHPLPASYANFLFANGGLFVPVFGLRSDDRALRLLEDALPSHRIVPVRAEHLVVGLGALHCLSQQEPRAGGSAAGG